MPSTDVIHLTLTLKMTTAQDVETSVTVSNKGPIQNYDHPYDQSLPTFEMTPGFKPFTTAKIYIYYPPTCDQAFLFAHGTLNSGALDARSGTP